MNTSQLNFQNRLEMISDKAPASQHGCSTWIDRDGSIVQMRRAPRPRNLTAKVLVLLAIGFFVFKGAMLSAVGSATYDTRVHALAEGTIFEQAGAFMMQRDPLSE